MQQKFGGQSIQQKHSSYECIKNAKSTEKQLQTSKLTQNT
jgi:hypothetical protein